MKAAIITLVFAGVAIGFWQRTEIESLHAAEALSLGERQQATVEGETSAAAQAEGDSVEPADALVSDEEVTAFSTDLISVRAEFATDRWYKNRHETWTENPKVCETLRRLTSQQLRAIIASWESSEPSDPQQKNGIHRFMNLAGMMNPRAALEVMYQLKDERGEKGVLGWIDVPLKSWFRKDPSALLAWLKEKGFPEGFNRSAQVWADAATVLNEPTTENVAKLVPVITGYAAIELARKLPTQESRTAFFRNLHAANGGKSDDVRTFVRAMADKVPFSQVAQIADAVPPFRPSVPEKKDCYDKMQPLGSLRFEVALGSRDGTPEQRWNWLVRQPDDRPTGKVLNYLLSQWCERDYSDVAIWARGLPPGEERDEIRKAIHTFVKEDQRMRPKGDGKDRAAEWEAR